MLFSLSWHSELSLPYNKQSSLCEVSWAWGCCLRLQNISFCCWFCFVVPVWRPTPPTGELDSRLGVTACLSWPWSLILSGLLMLETTTHLQSDRGGCRVCIPTRGLQGAVSGKLMWNLKTDYRQILSKLRSRLWECRVCKRCLMA